jgi:hypothetical protein
MTSDLTDINAYRENLTAEFDRLLAAAEAANVLYYLINLFGHGASRSNLAFLAEVNSLTTELVLRRASTSAPEPIPAHEMLFVLQANLESKAIYATMRNFAYVILAKCFRPEPWECGEYGGRPGRPAVLKTVSILRGLAGDLREAGFPRLAEELERTHIQDMGLIRNAVAHACFQRPSPGTNHQWIFGDWIVAAKGHIEIVLHEYSTERFDAICRRFFAYLTCLFRGVQGAPVTIH